MISLATFWISLSVVILAPLLCAEDKLEAVWSGKLRDAEYRDEDLGISLTITERPEKDRKGFQWGSGRGSETKKDGRVFSTWIRESNERTIVCAVPLEEKVFWKLIREASAPPEFRFVAITNVHDLATDSDTMAKMLGEAVEIPDEWVRGHAWSRVLWFPDRDKVAHLLPKAVKDPSLSIAHGALPEICKHYGLRNPDGSEIELTMEWRGEICSYYIVRHRELEQVAELLHKKHPELVSAEDLKWIAQSRVPPDAWFAFYTEGRRPKDLDWFLEPYKTKNPNKAQQDKPR